MATLKDSFQKMVQFITRRELIVLYFIGLSIFFVFILKNTAQLNLTTLFSQNPFILVGALLLSLVFAVFKSWAWHLAWHAQKINIPFSKSWKLFQISCFVDFLVFPSRVSSDIYKMTYLKRYTVPNKIRSVLLFRVGTALPYLVGLLLFLVLNKPIWFLIALPLILGALFFKRQALKKLADLKNNLMTLLKIFLITSFLITLEWGRASLILSIFGIPFSFNFFLWWMVSHVIGTLSGLPLGLGAKDFSLGVYFKDLLTLEQIGLFLILIRLTGEIFNALIGWILSGKDTLRLVFYRNRDPK